MITEDYCSNEVAELLKEKGFNEPITELNRLLFKEGKKPALKITHQKAMKWLREVHNVFIAINIVPHVTITMEQKYYFFKLYKDRRAYNFSNDSTKLYSSYEEACEIAIKYCLENLI